MKKIICTLCLVISTLCVMAQESKVVNLQFETRMDYQREYLDGDAVKSNSGFKGKYLNVILNGTINDHWSYSYRSGIGAAPWAAPWAIGHIVSTSCEYFINFDSFRMLIFYQRLFYYIMDFKSSILIIFETTKYNFLRPYFYLFYIKNLNFIVKDI